MLIGQFVMKEDSKIVIFSQSTYYQHFLTFAKVYPEFLENKRLEVFNPSALKTIVEQELIHESKHMIITHNLESLILKKVLIKMIFQLKTYPKALTKDLLKMGNLITDMVIVQQKLLKLEEFDTDKIAFSVIMELFTHGLFKNSFLEQHILLGKNIRSMQDLYNFNNVNLVASINK